MLLASTYQHLFVRYLAVQLIFGILHHVHISDASNIILFALVNIQISAADTDVIRQLAPTSADISHYTIQLVKKSLSSCDILYTNGKLHQACVCMTMRMWSADWWSQTVSTL